MRSTPFVLRASTGAILAAFVLVGLAACGAGDSSPGEDADPAAAGVEDAAALPAPRILEPTEGAELDGDVRVRLAAENIEIAPAGDTRPNSGHHHLFLNQAPSPEGAVIPADVDGIVHLGQAQTEHTFEALPPGEYTLIAMIGDLAHRVLPQRADTVRFRVVDRAN